MEDLPLLRRRHLSGINGKRDAALVAQVPKQRQLLGAGGIPPQSEHRPVGIPEDVVVGIELHSAGSYEVKEVLRDRLRFLPLGYGRKLL